MKLSSGICCCRGAVLTGLTCLFSKKKTPEGDEQTKDGERGVRAGVGGGDGTTMIIAAFVEGIKREKKEKQPAVTWGWLS